MRIFVVFCAFACVLPAGYASASTDVGSLISNIFSNVMMTASTSNGIHSTTNVSAIGSSSAKAVSHTILSAGKGTTYRVEVRTMLDGVEKVTVREGTTKERERVDVDAHDVAPTLREADSETSQIQTHSNTQSTGFLMNLFRHMKSFLVYF